MLVNKLDQLRVLIVSRDISIKTDGGTLVSKRNERILEQAGFKTERFIVPIPGIATRIRNIMFRQSYGETPSLRSAFLEKLKTKYDYIFFDGSIYGGFLKLASEMGFKTVCFYHNVEFDYYTQKFSQSKALADRLMVPYIKYNERLSTIHSRYKITLNERDSNHLTNIYGKGSDLILPTSFPAKDIKSIYQTIPKDGNSYLLFIGTNFFANVEGLERFMQRVAPKISKRVKVIGNIKEAFKNRKDIPNNVEFLGMVDNLDEYYVRACGVIVPIFTGSGLKTKTVEAISFGKTVIGYPEAFEGIDWKTYPGSCIQVESDEEFISVINSLEVSQRLNTSSIKLFEETLSDEIHIEHLRNLMIQYT